MSAIVDQRCVSECQLAKTFYTFHKNVVVIQVIVFPPHPLAS